MASRPPPSDREPGDAYIRTLATQIRRSEAALASSGLARRTPAPSAFSVPLSFIGLSSSSGPANPTPPLKMDLHHLYYLLIRIDGIGVSCGALDVRLETPSRPASYYSLLAHDSHAKDTSDTRSIMSSLSAVSSFSLTPSSWWSGGAPASSPDLDLKYLYSAFTKIPALRLVGTPQGKLVEEFADLPMDTAVPLDAFKNLQVLELEGVDIRALTGWDRLADGLRSLTIVNGEIEDVAELLLDAVLGDADRRANGSSKPSRRRVRQPSAATSDTVSEEVEELSGPTPDYPSLPPTKWRFLRHLSLSSNSLTFVPTPPLAHLASLTSLDFSSNLLVSAPPALAHLPNLAALNLSDNMIESVRGLGAVLGNVTSLNLARNRIECLSGLERVMGLERVDVRENRVEESAEVGRLAALPAIRAVWVAGNPLCQIEDDWRIRIFNYFLRESHTISLDGSTPTFYEQRYLIAAPEHPGNSSSRPTSTISVPSPPIVPVRRSSTASQTLPTTAAPLASSSDEPRKVQKRRKPKKRIVDIDAESMSASPASSAVEDGGANGVSRSSRPSPPDALASVSSTLAKHRTLRPSPSTLSLPPTPSGSPSASPARRADASARVLARKMRVSTSVYEPGGVSPGDGEGARLFGFGGEETDRFRARIEALRSEVGDSWLRVLSQEGEAGEREREREARSPPRSRTASSPPPSKDRSPALRPVSPLPPRAEEEEEAVEGLAPLERGGEGAADGIARTGTGEPVSVVKKVKKKKGKAKKKEKEKPDGQAGEGVAS